MGLDAFLSELGPTLHASQHPTCTKTAVRMISNLASSKRRYGTLESYKRPPLFPRLWTEYHAAAATRAHVHYTRFVTINSLPSAPPQKCLKRGEDMHSNANVENLCALIRRMCSTLKLMIHACIGTSRCSHGHLGYANGILACTQ